MTGKARVLSILALCLSFGTPRPRAAAAADGAPPPPGGPSSRPAADPGLTRELDELIALAERGDVTAAYFRSLLLVKLYPDEPRLVGLSKKLGALVDQARRAAAATSGPADGAGAAKAAAPARKRQTFEQIPLAEQIKLIGFEQRFAALAKQDGEARSAAAAALLRDVKKFNVGTADLPRSWLLQARLALAMDRRLDGESAAENLMELRVFESGSDQVLKTMIELDKRGWVPKR